MIIPQKPWEDHIEDLELYNSKRKEKGLGPRNPVVGCFMYCSNNQDELKQAWEEYMPNMNYSATRHYEFDEAEHFRHTRGYEALRRGGRRDQQRRGEGSARGYPGHRYPRGVPAEAS